MSRAHSSFIPSESIRVATDWEFGAVDQAALRFAAKLKAQADEEERQRAQAARDSGHSEGYNAGYAEGFAQGHAQATLEGQRLLREHIDTQGREAALAFARIFEEARQGVQDAEQTLSRGVLDLACAIARQVVRNELSINPNAVQPVIREALGMLTTDAKVALVRLHPQDLDLVQESLAQEVPNLKITLVPDPTLSRGGCLVESAGTVVDGTLERRWQRAVASLGLEDAWLDDGQTDAGPDKAQNDVADA